MVKLNLLIVRLIFSAVQLTYLGQITFLPVFLPFPTGLVIAAAQAVNQGGPGISLGNGTGVLQNR